MDAALTLQRPEPLEATRDDPNQKMPAATGRARVPRMGGTLILDLELLRQQGLQQRVYPCGGRRSAGLPSRDPAHLSTPAARQG